MTIKSFGRLVLCLAICLGVGVAGSLSTKPEIAGWYAGLAKPSWTPPPVVFPIAWTTLYILMAIAFWRLWDRAAPSALRGRAMILFAIQLALNAAWSPVFFGWHGIRTGLVIVALMVVTITATILSATRVDRIAAWLLVPYLCWVLYASTINAGVVALN
ncbi:TspO/MBR family protein [Tardiphaga sp. P9-11]|jgi:tryptophan-rich sensory protein|uniref:TspO/MBR family protein n=1 Tax=Tardiphaga sp. P9-11 TaxID=2024614 RepID=UPI0011F1E98D|nr:TspO/MBR family protein [Tardiphaga sp. P9-11]KAA0076401.1 tryptophan-rich sensory protein [Tardiphaga sp. P9-11]